MKLFELGDIWIDPPKCMPTYLHHDAAGMALDVVQSYRLYYAGHKVQIAQLKWEPYVERPAFLAKCQKYIGNRPDIQKGIEEDLKKEKKDRRQKERAKAKQKRLMMTNE